MGAVAGCGRGPSACVRLAFPKKSKVSLLEDGLGGGVQRETRRGASDSCWAAKERREGEAMEEEKEVERARLRPRTRKRSKKREGCKGQARHGVWGETPVLCVASIRAGREDEGGKDGCVSY